MTSAQKGIIESCIRNGDCSIADFSKNLSLSVPTVTKLVSELIGDGYLIEKGKVGTSGGRRPNTFGLNPDAGYFVGVDVARQHFHIAIADFTGNLKFFIQDIFFILEANADSFRTICRKIKEVVTDSGIYWEKVLGIGISLSGRVNPEKGFSLSYFVSDDIPLKDIFQRELGAPVGIENDSRAMTYGEYMSSNGQADRNMLFINLSWGLGMGMILDAAAKSDASRPEHPARRSPNGLSPGSRKAGDPPSRTYIKRKEKSAFRTCWTRLKTKTCWQSRESAQSERRSGAA